VVTEHAGAVWAVIRNNSGRHTQDESRLASRRRDDGCASRVAVWATHGDRLLTHVETRVTVDDCCMVFGRQTRRETGFVPRCPSDFEKKLQVDSSIIPSRTAFKQV
jgi:hypothetical protein